MNTTTSVTETTGTLPAELVPWPDGVDAYVLPGVPGNEGFSTKEGREGYPSEVTDIVKIMRGGGARVAKPDAPIASFKDVDYVTPILIFLSSALANGVGNLFADAVRERIDAWRSRRMHTKFGITYGDGKVRWFEGEGPANEVLEAMDKVLRAK